MNTREKLRSDSLNLLRFPLAVVVLTIHTFNSAGTFTMRGQEYDFSALPLFMGINHFIDGFLRGQSVPVYFFISVYVFFLGLTWSKEVYKKKLQNRTKTLLIPFVIWNVIALAFPLLLWNGFPSLFPNAGKIELDFSFLAFLNTFWDSNHGVIIPRETPINNLIYPQDYPLWFVRDLMIVVLCTPILFYLLKRCRQYLVCLLGIAWFVLAHWDLGHINQLFSAFFFFSWGTYISISNKDMLAEFGKYSKLSAILYFSFSLLHVVTAYWMPDLCQTIKRFNILFGLYFFYNLAAWLLKRKICKPNAFLASASFFIYVAHGVLIAQILKVLFFLIAPSSNLGVLCVYVSAVLLTIGLLLAIFWFLRRYAPAFLKVIAGRK